MAGESHKIRDTNTYMYTYWSVINGAKCEMHTFQQQQNYANLVILIFVIQTDSPLFVM